MAHKLSKNYKSYLNKEETIYAINILSALIEKRFGEDFDLIKVDSPLLSYKTDRYNSHEKRFSREIGFDIYENGNIVSLFNNHGKWRREFLNEEVIKERYSGLYTTFSTIDRDIFELSNTKSPQKDYIDIEISFSLQNYNYDFFKILTSKVFKILKKIENELRETIVTIPDSIPNELKIYDWETLVKSNPHLNELDVLISKIYYEKLIFVMNGVKSSLARDMGWVDSPDLNHEKWQGSFVAYNPYSKEPYPITSVIMRTNNQTLLNQIENSKLLNLKNNKINKKIISGEFMNSLLIRIHKANLALFLLHKLHIAEVQPIVWSDEMIKEFKNKNIDIL